MKDRYGNEIKVGATFKLIRGNTIHVGELGVVQEVCEDAKYLVGSFEDREPVLQIGIGKEPVAGTIRFPMTVYPGEIEIQGGTNGF